MKNAIKLVLFIAIILFLVNSIGYSQERRPGDSLGNFNFRVEIEGVFTGSVLQILGFTSETEVIEYRDSAELTGRKIPGHTSYSNVIIRRG